jgi:hypothetical protein
MVNAMEDPNVVTVLPPASAAATTGCVPKATLTVPFEGCCVKTNWDAAPVVIVKVPLGAEGSAPLVAVRV